MTDIRDKTAPVPFHFGSGRLEALWLWIRRARKRASDRRALLKYQSIDPRFANDIGLSAEVVEWEARQPFWRAPIKGWRTRRRTRDRSADDVGALPR
jgi:hypothetical protein